MIDLNDLNKEQREAVCHTEGPLLILAGAGSGKTRVLTYRTAYLVENGVDPWNILAITFTNKAAGEMRDRIDALVGHGAESIWVSTFHSACVRILRRYIDRLDYETDFVIYDTADQKTLMKETLKSLGIDPKQYREKMFLGAISSAKDELIDAEMYGARSGNDKTAQMIAAVYKEYDKRLRKNNALDFDDLIMLTVKLLKKDDEVRDYWQERFKYVMVDEYQDTNTAQFELVRLFAGKYRNLCVVGDDDQSIYKFRGANIRNILDFEKTYPDAYVVKLEENYRSTANILNAANAVIKNNRSRKSKTLRAARGDGERVNFMMFDYAREEAEYIVSDINIKAMRGRAPYGDNAVLYRTNAQSRLLEESFVRAGVPYKIIGGTNFYSRREIKDMLAYLKTIAGGRDDVSVRRILNVPKRGIGQTSENRVAEYAETYGISFYDALKDAENIPGLAAGAVKKIKGFTELISVLRSKAEYLGISELVEAVSEDSGYMASLEELDEEERQERKDNIGELVSKAASYEETAQDATLSAFLEEVALVADIDSLEEQKDYVVLMTLHAAKGLEFPCVYLAGMEDGLFPGFMSITSGDPTDIEEERRLCYVGITRARDHLTMTAAGQRMINGQTQYNSVSRFVREIPQEYVKGAIPAKRERREPGDIFGGGFGAGSRRDQGFGSGFGSGLSSDAERFPERKSRARIIFDTPAYEEPKARFDAGAADSNEAPSGGAYNLGYDIGDTVRHIKFGTGTVQKIEKGGRDYEVTVCFDKFGVKKMFATFAKLKKV